MGILGNNVAGGTAHTGVPAGYQLGFGPFVAGESGQIASILSYLAVPVGASARMAVYANNAGVPGALLATSNEISTGAGTSWRTFPLASPLAISNGTSYWFALIYSATTSFHYDAGTKSLAYRFLGSYQTPANPFGTADGSFGSRDYSAYAAIVPADSTPPTITARTIGTGGNTIVLTADEAITAGGGGSGGLTLSMTGGAVTATYGSGSGGTSITYNLSRTIGADETGTATYTQPGSGWEDAAGNDLASFSGAAITNNSEQTIPAPSGLSVPALTSSSVNLSWNDNSTTNTGYTLQFDTDDTFPSPTTVDIPNGTAISGEIEELESGETYYFRVRAYKGASSSEWSNTASATAAAPGSPFRGRFNPGGLRNRRPLNRLGA